MGDELPYTPVYTTRWIQDSRTDFGMTDPPRSLCS